jgi:hypothetical protein
MSGRRPWQIAATGFPVATKEATKPTAARLMRNPIGIHPCPRAGSARRTRRRPRRRPAGSTEIVPRRNDVELAHLDLAGWIDSRSLVAPVPCSAPRGCSSSTRSTSSVASVAIRTSGPRAMRPPRCGMGAVTMASAGDDFRRPVRSTRLTPTSPLRPRQVINRAVERRAPSARPTIRADAPRRGVTSPRHCRPAPAIEERG